MIGLVTIGQAPRTDVVSSMFAARPHVSVIEAGALDGLPREAIVLLKPGRGEHVLVTRLVDGSEVTVAKERVTPLVQRAIESLAERGADAICVLCTGEFSGLQASVPIIYPDRVLVATVDAVKPDGTLGILMPHMAQRDSMIAKWSRPNRTVVTDAASPYVEHDSPERVSRSLTQQGAETIVMDCMGFDHEMRRRVARCVDVPVVLANALVGAVLLETVAQ